MSNTSHILSKPWDIIVELAATYPSPHNSQPLWIKPINQTDAEIYFDLERGLPAESYGIAFGFVTIGIFLEIIKIAAHSQGYEVTDSVDYSDLDYSGELGLKKIATISLQKIPEPIPDLPVELIRKRKTSRLNYEHKTVDSDAIQAVTMEAQKFSMLWHDSTDPAVVNKVVAVNQRTLFYDMENSAVRNEIGHWLRFSKAHASTTKDGLSAECMNVNGVLLKAFVKLHALWKLPILSTVAQNAYLSTMQGVTQIAWLTTKFETNQDYVRSGRAFIRIWLIFTQKGVALHPFGSVITNQRAHKEFCDIVGENEQNGMAWMLLRIGYSQEPPKSWRRELDEFVLWSDALTQP